MGDEYFDEILSNFKPVFGEERSLSVAKLYGQLIKFNNSHKGRELSPESQEELRRLKMSIIKLIKNL